MRRARVLVALSATVVAAGLGACFEPVDGGACHSDRQCPDSVCSNVGECASSTYALRVRWTVHGVAANTPGVCDNVDKLEVTVSDPSVESDFTWSPVPCSIGTSLYDRMPPGYDVVSVTAYGPGGFYLTSAGGTADPATGVVQLDLRP